MQTMRISNLPLGVAILVLLLLHPCLQAQDTTKIDIDHASGIMKVNGKTVDTDTVRIPASDVMTISVIKTNTALYDYNLAGERIDVKDISSIQEFTKALGPYLIDIPSILSKGNNSATKPESESYAMIHLFSETQSGKIATTGATVPEDPQLKRLAEKGKAVKSELATLNNLVYGDHGLLQIRMDVLAALSRMANGEPIIDVVKDVSGRLDSSCRRRALSSGLLKQYTQLRKDIVAFDVVLDSALDKLSDSDRNRFRTALDKGREAIDDYDNILATAYAVEALGISALDARDTWTIERKPSVAWNSGRTVSLTITQKKAIELARLAKADTTYSVIVMPEWRFRTSVGLALTFTPAAAFPTYKAEKSGDVYTITELSAEGQNLRFNYGLVLGVSWLNDGTDELGPALWLPEITVNPSEGVKSIGLGLGFSWNVFKVGMGSMWTRRKVLDGKIVNATISDAEIPLRDEYSTAQFYFSLSVIGWQPFVK